MGSFNVYDLPIFGAFGPFYEDFSGASTIKDATKSQLAALDKAFQAIQDYTNKAIDQQKPYTQHAGEDFNRMRGLVQNGYFQTPYGQSFNPQQYAPSGFSMNPSQGTASFRPQSFGLMGYTPQGLPPMSAQQQQPSSQIPSDPDIAQRVPQPNLPQPVDPMMPAYNPQTGQNSPLRQWKPQDPRFPTLDDLTRYRIGSSGPYGVQMGGLL